MIDQIHFSSNLQLFGWEQVQRTFELYLEAEEYLNNPKCTKLVFLFMVEDIKPKSLSNCEILLFYFHTCLNWLSSLYCFLDYLVYFVKIDSCLTYQVVETNQISVPDLNCKNVGIHILRFRRIVNREFKSIVEITNWSTSPMSISFLRLASTDNSSNKNIIRFHLYIFVDTIICFPNDNSELILIKRWRMNLMNRSTNPIFLFNQINPSLKSSLCTNTEFWIQISKFYRFFLIEMPLSCEVSLFNIDFCVS